MHVILVISGMFETFGSKYSLYVISTSNRPERANSWSGPNYFQIDGPSQIDYGKSDVTKLFNDVIVGGLSNWLIRIIPYLTKML